MRRLLVCPLAIISWGEVMSDSILRLDKITKMYDNGVLANHNIDIDIMQGEIHAIVGENGAGKSTLMKIIFGLEQPSSGEIYLRGKKTILRDVYHAINLGIGMVHQHFMLVPSFTVTQNIVLGMEPKKGLFVDYNKAYRWVGEFAEKYKFQVRPHDKVEAISVGMKQKVEIMKALIRGAKLLILDEPTAVLTPQETEELFEQLKILKTEGHTIIFISHKLKEVKAICDRVTVIRRGKSMGVFPIKDVTVQSLSNLMVGKDVALSYEKKKMPMAETVLSVKGLSTDILKEISFTIQKGMILGVAGVEGNGQVEMVQILSGNAANCFLGDVSVCGKPVRNSNIAEMRKDGLSYIPEDRMHMGCALEASLKDNYISNRYLDKELYRGLLMNHKKIKTLSDKLIADYQVLCKNSDQEIAHLSGGNIQKVVVGRECSVNPQLLISEQPTRGVDLGAAEIIHKKMLEMRERGTGILLISADIAEVLELSDHLIVMYQGGIAAFIEDPSTITEKELGEYMLGVKRQSPEEIGGAYREPN